MARRVLYKVIILTESNVSEVREWTCPSARTTDAARDRRTATAPRTIDFLSIFSRASCCVKVVVVYVGGADEREVKVEGQKKKGEEFAKEEGALSIFM